MALLKQTETGEVIALHSHHTFGRRQDSVDTLIPKDEVSKIHAVISWTGNEWVIRCLATNGTFVDRKQLPPDEPTKLEEGQVIGFSGPETAAMVVADLHPPKDLLLPLNDNSSLVTLEDYHLLPDDQQAINSCYFCNQSKGWVVDTVDQHSDHHIPLKHGEKLAIGDHAWQLFLAEKLSPTKLLNTVQNTVDDYVWLFDVSPDEENVALTLKKGSKTINLGERSHYYLLMQLARHKYDHVQDDVKPDAAGWVPKYLLEKEIGLNESHLNIQLHRACKQLAPYFSFTTDKPDTLLRRRGQIKLCCTNFVIKKGGEVTHMLNIGA